MIAFVVIWPVVPLLASDGIARLLANLNRPLIALGLAVLCALQPNEANSDRDAYSALIATAIQESWLDVMVIEPGFYLMAHIAQAISATYREPVLYFMMAWLSLSIKFRLFQRFGGSVSHCLILFLAYFFLLHEVTQIRIGVAIGWMYLSLLEWRQARRMLAVRYALLSLCFHYSAVLVLPLLLLSRELQAPLAKPLIASLLGVMVVALMPGTPYMEYVFMLANANGIEKLVFYVDALQDGLFDEANFLNRLAPHVILAAMLLLLRRQWMTDQTMHTLLRTYLCGMLLFVALSPFPLIAYRVSDVFLFSSVLLCGRLALHVRWPKAYTLGLMLYASVFLTYSIGFSGMFSSA
jgi:hypothetical protein